MKKDILSNKVILRSLAFFNLLDAQGNLSITNILVIAMGVKVLSLPEIDLTAFAAFATVVVNYRMKSLQLKSVQKVLSKTLSVTSTETRETSKDPASSNEQDS